MLMVMERTFGVVISRTVTYVKKTQNSLEN